MNVNALVPVVVLLIGAGCDLMPAATAAQGVEAGIASGLEADRAQQVPPPAEESSLPQRDGALHALPPAADSILPMQTMIARFQADLPVVDSLGSDAPRSIDELVTRFVEAVEDSSTVTLAALTLSRAEFAYLYFPTSIHARPPYAQPPSVNWLLLEQNSLKGRYRLLRRFGGTHLHVTTHHCAGTPLVQGANRIHETCVLRIRGEDGRTEDVRLFGSIVERDGRFKLLSLSNRL